MYRFIDDSGHEYGSESSSGVAVIGNDIGGNDISDSYSDSYSDSNIYSDSEKCSIFCTSANHLSEMSGDERNDMPRHDMPRHDMPRHDMPRHDNCTYTASNFSSIARPGSLPCTVPHSMD